MKRSALKRHTPLRQRRRRVDRTEPGRVAWKTQQAGFCECCGRFSLRLERHHVYPLELIRREGGDPWAMSNAMLLHPLCHARHTSAFRRIPVNKVPDAAVDFAKRLLGEDRAGNFFARYYGKAEP